MAKYPGLTDSLEPRLMLLDGGNAEAVDIWHSQQPRPIYPPPRHVRSIPVTARVADR